MVHPREFTITLSMNVGWHGWICRIFKNGEHYTSAYGLTINDALNRGLHWLELCLEYDMVSDSEIANVINQMVGKKHEIL